MNLEEYLSRKHTPGTARRYLRDIRIYLQANPNAGTAGYQDIINYIGRIRKQYANGATIATALHGIKKYYGWLIETGQRQSHPCKYLKLRDSRNKDVQLQDLFKPEELELLMERKERYSDLKTRNQVIIGLLIYQGLQTGEIANLELKDIDLEKAEIHIKRSSKTNARTLQLKPKQVMVFYRYIYEIRPKLIKKPTEPALSAAEGRLIINKSGNPENGEQISYLVSTYKHLFTERNLNPKTIRQSVIANLLKAGHDLRVVQVFAGHKYPSATEKYKQDDVEALKQAVLKYHPLK